MSDGPRHVLLALIAVVGGVPLFGACCYFFGSLLLKWMFPDPPNYTWRQRFLLERMSFHQIVKMKAEGGAYHLQGDVTSILVFGLSGVVTGAFVWVLMRFW